MDAYIHRVGRTGRGGDKTGSAYTLLTRNGTNDKAMAPKLLNMLKTLRMIVSQELEQMVNGGNKRKSKKEAPKKMAGLETTFVRATDNDLSKSSFVPKKKRKTRWGN
eukprot:CAMPEP_0201597240 /NCGR_PEP_ID=MMETSP0190_2-20130828/193787_1 /ASSEMBLY_ACC=CAM_ASM_000263 /TAXON_ID=37353 /ORGANISM="Rosalina sp." /LENGTH=106 /DNA_ID=CAMNT_0048058117 /DNA_START=1676 /DNA_END=1996 /DNA_ORIENTATION=+